MDDYLLFRLKQDIQKTKKKELALYKRGIKTGQWGAWLYTNKRLKELMVQMKQYNKRNSNGRISSSFTRRTAKSDYAR